MPFFHYTSRLGGQDIVCAHTLEPGRSGLLYLSDVRYESGALAANELAITGKPVELGVAISIPDGTEIGTPGVVEAWRNSVGELVREGGGREFTVVMPIPVEAAEWFTLQAP